jgi:hypothetical protein
MTSILTIIFFVYLLRGGWKNPTHHWMDDYRARGEENKKRNKQ